jgi:hypothetical protein
MHQGLVRVSANARQAWPREQPRGPLGHHPGNRGPPSEGAAISWQILDFDFTGVVFDGGDFSRVVFCGGEVDFSDAVFSGSSVSFCRAMFSGGRVDFDRAQFSRSGRVGFDHAVFSGSTITFSDARFYALRMSRAAYWVTGFPLMYRSKGHVDFSLAADWSHPPIFDWKGTPPPGSRCQQPEPLISHSWAFAGGGPPSPFRTSKHEPRHAARDMTTTPSRWVGPTPAQHRTRILYPRIPVGRDCIVEDQATQFD